MHARHHTISVLTTSILYQPQYSTVPTTSPTPSAACVIHDTFYDSNTTYHSTVPAHNHSKASYPRTVGCGHSFGPDFERLVDHLSTSLSRGIHDVDTVFQECTLCEIISFLYRTNQNYFNQNYCVLFLRTTVYNTPQHVTSTLRAASNVGFEESW